MANVSVQLLAVHAGITRDLAAPGVLNSSNMNAESGPHFASPESCDV
jgi:hypothetical protein